MNRLAVLASLAMASIALSTQGVHAEPNDAVAIAKFLQIGFANAPSNFRSLSGKRYGESAEHLALTWPDRTLFSRCYVRIDSEDLVQWGFDEFICTSTARRGSVQALYAMAAKAVRHNLPPGYVAGLQSWCARKACAPLGLSRKASDSPKIWLYANPDGASKAYYEIHITAKTK